MKRRWLILFFTAILLFPFISSASIDSELQKMTHYAEEYETGNIDYVQFRVYLSSARESINEILGARGKHEGGILKQEQIKNALGEPDEETKWVWVEGEEGEKKLDEPVPVWRNIVFDGEKIQIRLEAYPSIFSEKMFKGPSSEEEGFKEENSFEGIEGIKEGDLIYRLHFNIEFKKPEEQLDIQSKIDAIQILAQAFNADPSEANAEALAEESVNAEKIFNNYFRQGSGNCEEIMDSVFGAENKRQSQQISSSEIELFSKEKVEAIMHLEMCDECEWNWVNLEMRLETRGKFDYPKGTEIPMHSYKDFTDDAFRTETAKLIDEIKSSLEIEDYESAVSSSNKLRMLTQDWNEKSNNVWEQVQKEFEEKRNLMTEEERIEFDQNFGWIKQEQEQRQKVKELQKQNYENRKQFYSTLFAGYDKKEYSFSQTDYEKRLVEIFRQGGEEICSNNIDDNQNEQIDCGDAQCGGKICGKGTKIIAKENSTTNETEEIEVDFYCIQSICQAKEEIVRERESVCGNKICEKGEADSTSQCSGENETICNPFFIPGTCAQDCALCEEQEPLNCSGKVVFSGKDENGCPLEPVCIEEKVFCNTNEDCIQPLCGEATCGKTNPDDIQGTCRIKEIKECRPAECVEGDKKIEKCNSGEELVNAVCEDGIWTELDKKCEETTTNLGCFRCGDSCISAEDKMTMGCGPSTEYFECFEQQGRCIKEAKEKIVECVVKEDCGRENDVCSNGKCVTLPEIIPIAPEPEPVSQEQPQTETAPEPASQQSEQSQPEATPESETPTTGEIIFGSFQVLLSNLGLTGKQVDEGGAEPNGGNEEIIEPNSEEQHETLPDIEGGSKGERRDEENWNQEQWQDDSQQWQEREEERERREQENRQRCEGECVRPCIETCTREACGENMDCNIEEEIKKCETTCLPEQNCIEKCMSGDENWWQEFQPEDTHKEEKGVFQAGGGCRKEKQQTNGFLWFGGWGEPFERIEPLKQKYYQGEDGADWCKKDLENFIKQRQEFEKGFNQEFAQWFFEKYLVNSAEDWEQSVSGIFEMYWTNVQNIMETAHRMECAETEAFPNYNLINFQYESEYGKIEYWEEMKTAKVPGLEKEMTLPTPYMKVWVFPSKEFMKYEMKTSMNNHEFPGPPEEKLERRNQEGPTEQEREMIKQDEKFMKQIREISEKYGGNLGISIQFKDYETDEVVFNIYAQVNENDIVKMQPMPVEEMPDKDVTIEIDFEKIYEMVYMQEKEMRGEETQFPPWDMQERRGGIKEIRNNVKSSVKMMGIMNSAKVIPEESEKDVKPLFKLFMKMASKGDGKRGGPPEEDVGGENGFEDRENLKQGEGNFEEGGFEEGGNEGRGGFGFE